MQTIVIRINPIRNPSTVSRLATFLTSVANASGTKSNMQTENNRRAKILPMLAEIIPATKAKTSTEAKVMTLN